VTEKTFWNLKLEEKGKGIARELGRNGLVLSGFSITALAFIFSLFKEQILGNLLILKLFFASLIVYFIVSEVARNAIYYWEYALADLGYFGASFCLFLALALFILGFGLGVEIFILIWFLLILLTSGLIYSTYGLIRMISQDRRHNHSDTAQNN